MTNPNKRRKVPVNICKALQKRKKKKITDIKNKV